MTTPTGPTPVPVGSAKPFPPGSKPMGAPAGGGTAGLKRFAGTTQGKVTLAGGGVAVFALYKRRQAAKAAGGATGATGTDTAATSGATSAGGYTANTTGSDAYNALEPLIENLSGFSGTEALQQQLAANQAALLAALNGGKGTTNPGTGTAAPGSAPGPSQIHAVGKVGTMYNLYNYVLGLYPKATGAQIAQITYNTINDPANARYRNNLVAGFIPGGARITFDSSPVKGTPAPAAPTGPLHDIALKPTAR